MTLDLTHVKSLDLFFSKSGNVSLKRKDFIYSVGMSSEIFASNKESLDNVNRSLF